MPLLKLIKETNDLGEIFYSMQKDGIHIAGSVVYGGNSLSTEEYLNERFAEAKVKYDNYIKSYNPNQKSTETIIEQDI